MTDRIENIRERLSQITAPPWRIVEHPDVWTIVDGYDEDVADMFGDPDEDSNEMQNNAIFIATAASDIEYLLEELDQAYAELDALGGDE